MAGVLLSFESPISMDYPDDGNGKTRFDCVVGSNRYGIGIAAFGGFEIFHPEYTAVARGVALLDQLTTNNILSLGLYPENSKRIVLILQNFDLDCKRCSGLAFQAHLCWLYFNEFIHFSGHNQRYRRLLGIVGLYMHRFSLFPSTIVAGVESDGNASFLPGKDPPRT